MTMPVMEGNRPSDRGVDAALPRNRLTAHRSW